MRRRADALDAPVEPLRLEVDERRWPPTVAIVGLVGCIALVASLPPEAIAGGAAVIIAGVAVRAASVR